MRSSRFVLALSIAALASVLTFCALTGAVKSALGDNFSGGSSSSSSSGGSGSAGGYHAQAYMSADLSTTNDGTFHLLNFDTTVTDSAVIISRPSGITRFTARSAGPHLVTGILERGTTVSSSGNWFTAIFKNGSIALYVNDDQRGTINCTDFSFNAQTFSHVFNLDVGDYIQVGYATNLSNGAPKIIGGQTITTCAVTFLGVSSTGGLTGTQIKFAPGGSYSAAFPQLLFNGDTPAYMLNGASGAGVIEPHGLVSANNGVPCTVFTFDFSNQSPGYRVAYHVDSTGSGVTQSGDGSFTVFAAWDVQYPATAAAKTHDCDFDFVDSTGAPTLTMASSAVVTQPTVGNNGLVTVRLTATSSIVGSTYTVVPSVIFATKTSSGFTAGNN